MEAAGILIPLAVACAALLVSPWASELPDGLEKVAGQLGLLPGGAALFAPLADYRLPAVAHPALTTILAGLCGALLTFVLAWLLGNGLERKSASSNC